MYTVVSLISVSIQVDCGIDLYSLQCRTKLKIGTLIAGYCCLSSLVTMKNRICIQDQCNIGSCSLIYANIFDFMQMYNWPFFGQSKLAGTGFWAQERKKWEVSSLCSGDFSREQISPVTSSRGFMTEHFAIISWRDLLNTHREKLVDRKSVV